METVGFQPSSRMGKLNLRCVYRELSLVTFWVFHCMPSVTATAVHPVGSSCTDWQTPQISGKAISRMAFPHGIRKGAIPGNENVEGELLIAVRSSDDQAYALPGFSQV